MSIEHDQSTRKQMRSGITGENVLRPLDEFSVTRTELIMTLMQVPTPAHVAAYIKQVNDRLEAQLFNFGLDTSAQIDPSTLDLARQAVVWKDRV